MASDRRVKYKPRQPHRHPSSPLPSLRPLALEPGCRGEGRKLQGTLVDYCLPTVTRAAPPFPWQGGSSRRRGVGSLFGRTASCVLMEQGDGEVRTPTSSESTRRFIRTADVLSAFLAAPIAVGLRDPSLFSGVTLAPTVGYCLIGFGCRLADGDCLSPWAKRVSPGFRPGGTLRCRGLACRRRAKRGLRFFPLSVGLYSPIPALDPISRPVCAHAGRPRDRDVPSWFAEVNAPATI